MKTAFQIFRRDVRRLLKNRAATLVMIGVCLLPSLYAWFNILSNWDPYGPSATRNLKIAVASDDEGVTILGNSVNVGSSVISALESNTTMGWGMRGNSCSPAWDYCRPVPLTLMGKTSKRQERFLPTESDGGGHENLASAGKASKVRSDVVPFG